MMTRFWKRPATGAWVLLNLGLTLIGHAQSNQVDGVSFAPTTQNGGTAGNVTYGFQFTVNTLFEITALGIFDPGPAGLAESHTVALWNSSGTLLRSVTIPAGYGGYLVDQFFYEPLAPYYLNAGQTYIIGAYYQDAGEDLVQNVTGLQVNPDISINNYRFAHPGFADPPLVITQDGNPGFQNLFGPNFLVNDVLVPEPDTFCLIGAGLSWLAWRRCSKRG
jgi:hypothetical protein